MAVTAEQIQGWIKENPNASTDQIQQAMNDNGVSSQMLASVLGVQPLLNAPAEVQMMQYNNWSSGAPEFTNDANRASIMERFGLTPQEAAQYSNIPVAEIQKRYDTGMTQAKAPITKGAVTDYQIQTYLAGNSKASDANLLALMEQYGVTPAQMARATGRNIGQIQQRVDDVKIAKANNQLTGLAGYEDAINKGLFDTTKTLRDAETLSRQDLSTSQNEVARLYSKNIAGLQDAGNLAAQDLTSAQEQVAKLYGLNIADIQAAGLKARTDVEDKFKTAGSYYTPYQQAGTQALTLQQALSGASGQQAFDQAYQESPYIAFLREQGMRANLAGASATGGLGGGNVQKELNRFGQGLASQGLQQQIGNLQNLSAQGLNAAGGAAGVQTGLGTNLANLGTGTAGDVSNQRGALAGYESGTGTNLANLRTGTASNIANQGSQLAGYVSGTGINLANIGQQTGANVANFQGSAASGIATQRMKAGESLQNQINAASNTLANLANAQGTNLATAYQNQTGAVQNLNTGAANAYSGLSTELASQQSALAAGQEYTRMPVPDYAQQYRDVFNAGSAGYELGGMAGQPKPTTQPTTFDPNFKPTIYTPASGGSIARGVNTMGSPLSGTYPKFLYNY